MKYAIRYYKKFDKALNGVSITPVRKETGILELASVKDMAKCGIDKALEDVRMGRVSGPFNSFDEMLAHALK